MIGALKNVYSLCDRRLRRRLYWLFLAVIVMALLQASSIASIVPFMSVVLDPGLIQRNSYLARFYEWSASTGKQDFLFMLGVMVLIVLLVSNVFSAVTQWWLLRFSNLLGHELSQRLLVSYVYQPYEFHLQHHSAELSKNILQEANRVTRGVLTPITELFAGGMSVLFVFAVLVIADPILAVTVVAGLGAAYLFIYLIHRRKLHRIGEQATEASRHRFRAVVEAFGVIKYLKLVRGERKLVQRHRRHSQEFAEHNATARAIAVLPKYVLEIVAFGGLLLIVLYLLRSETRGAQILPLVALYAFAGYRLVPRLQRMFQAVTNIKYHLPALNLLLEELSFTGSHSSPTPVGEGNALRGFTRRLELRNVSYAYPGTASPAVEGINLTIERGAIVGVAGATGSGKSTVIDLLLGLIPPVAGELVIDDIVMKDANVASWQRHLGYVPQQIYLLDDTVRNNITFGCPGDVDDRDVVRAAKMARLHEFVTRRLNAGYDTRIGEQGKRLSGGEQQRIGIARALYRKPDVLVLDEGTSALDAITENAILEELSSSSADTTVILITHRLSTLKRCDLVYMMERGRVVSSGTYAKLRESCRGFEQMVAAGGGRADRHAAMSGGSANSTRNSIN